MANEQRPRILKEYLEWAKDLPISVNFASLNFARLYKQNLTQVKQSVDTHEFFQDLEDFLSECQKEYRKTTNSDLFMSQPSERDDRIELFQRQPKIYFFKKPYKSAVEKSFRYNVLENNPSGELGEPKGKGDVLDGWCTPMNWFEIFPDMVRTMIVCKYKDGPEFLARKLVKYAKDKGLVGDYGSREKDDGYYAFHYYVTLPCKLDLDNPISPPPIKKLVETDVKIEIQLTTQLQEAMNQISHGEYAKARLKTVRTDQLTKSWKWDFESKRFKVAYLSHALHLLESIILDIRSRDTESKKAN